MTTMTTRNGLLRAAAEREFLEFTEGNQETKANLERVMKNLKTKLLLATLLTLVLLACTTAFGQITPSQDSYTSTATPTKNFGAATTLNVESSQTTFIQFNLSSIPPGYTSADITKATLKLYVDGLTTAGSFNVDYVNGSWEENTIDASNAPALGTTIVASVPLTTADKNQYILIDITPAVQAWLNGTANDGIALVANSPLNASFDSKEATKTSHTAELDVVFAGGGGTGITSITAGTDLTGGGTSGNVTLNVDTTKVPQLASANTFTTNQTVNGTVTASSFSGNGANLTGVTAANSSELGGLAPSAFAQLAANNTFTGAQTINNAVTITSASASSLTSTSTAAAGGYGVYAAGIVGVLGTDYGSPGIGVYGYDSTQLGTGVFGLGLTGVSGSDNGTAGGTGVLGEDGSTTGYGVYGVGATGVYGRGFGVGLGGTGVYGTGTPGVYGTDNGAAGGIGVSGADTSGGGTGVYGSGEIGVEGRDTGAGGIGVYGFDGSTSGIGVLASGGSFGVFGVGFNGPGVYGASQASQLGGLFGGAVEGQIGNGSGTTPPYYSGVWGDVASIAGESIAVVGTAGENFGAFFENNGSNYTSLIAQNNAASSSSALVFESFGGHFGGKCTIDVSGNLTCSGTVKAVVEVEGARKVAVYSMQSPENWFEDAGSGQLSGGSAQIEFDPTFAQTVNAGVEYHVFLTPKGDCRGLYVANESAKGFEVHELGGGNSSIAFDYRIMAKRAGYENVRLADLTEESNRLDAEHQKMQSRMRPAAARSFPKLPAPPKPPAELKPPVLPKPPALPKPALPTHAAMKPVAAEQK